jgi:phage terminase small subunit
MHPRYERFVDEYLIDLNPRRAAIAAGYVGTSKGYPSEKASRLLKRRDVQAALAQRKTSQIKKAEVSASAVLDQLRALSMVDIRSFFDDDGALLPPSQWTTDMGCAVSSFDVVKRNVTSGDGKVDDVFRIRLADKVRALEMLAKHFGLLVDRVDHSGAVVFVHEQPDEPVAIEHAVAVPVPALPEGTRS